MLRRPQLLDGVPCACQQLCLRRLLRSALQVTDITAFGSRPRGNAAWDHGDETWHHSEIADVGMNVWMVRSLGSPTFSVETRLPALLVGSHYMTFGLFDTNIADDIVTDVIAAPEDHTFVFVDIRVEDVPAVAINWYVPGQNARTSSMHPITFVRCNAWTCSIEESSCALFCNNQLISAVQFERPFQLPVRRQLAALLIHRRLAPHPRIPVRNVYLRTLIASVPQAVGFASQVKRALGLR